MAISQGDAPPLVVVAVDNLGIRLPQVNEVAAALKKSHRLPHENFALTFTHTHCAPKVNGACDNIFSQPIPADHQTRIDRYTKEFVSGVIRAARQALDDQKPSTLHWGIGSVDFAKNRRPQGGPVDHSLPTLIVRDAENHRIRGVHLSYACHCVTLRFNQISGDWAGYAAEFIERQFEGAVALVSIGAGSDQNPTEVSPEDTAVAARQGREIASEIGRLADGPMKPVRGTPKSILHRIDLPLETLPTRGELLQVAENGPRPTDRHNASTQIAKLDRGEALQSRIDYPIQTWTFGDSLCITFLAGEVCVDYAIRLKEELDADRFWLIAYSNDFCSYIPSERLIKEGGYGGGSEIPYFALPAKLAPGVEARIVDQVRQQTPIAFSKNNGVQGVAPKSAKESLQCIQTHSDLQVQLVAAEPLVCDPVAIDFGADACLWVAEMPDYGRGVYEQFSQSGRIRCLRDLDSDGQLDDATTFIDGLRFPTDIKTWRDGVLICDAPEILFARDTDSDGVADSIETLFSGFEVRNAQARVNSLRWGLDNWLHGSCGLFGGEIKSHKTGETISLVGRDFRLKPDTGEIEAVTGRTQQGLARNDWGDWFGCSNGTLLRHYSVVERYQRRNPYAASPTSRGLKSTPDVHRLFPPQNTVRFELSGAPGKATSACGLGIYRDTVMGDEYFGNAFTCEPVNQLVHRIKLAQSGVGYLASRGSHETDSEFLTSTDRWFRPVQVRTGPDGALWVVDMYRYVIEHPRWIPQSTLAEVDVFAGRQHGRIYRVSSSSAHQTELSLADLTKTTTSRLARMLESSNGVKRDLAHQMLLWRASADVTADLRTLVERGKSTQARIHALAVLDGLESLSASTILGALQDEQAEVVRHAVRLSEPFLDSAAEVLESVSALASHANPRVRRQVAWSLGEAKTDAAAEVLARLASVSEQDADVRGAVLSSIHKENAPSILQHYCALPQSAQVSQMLSGIGLSAIRMSKPQDVVPSIDALSRHFDSYALLAEVLDAVDARATSDSLVFSDQTCRKVSDAHAAALRELSADALKLLGRYRGAATKSLMAASSESLKSSDAMLTTMAELVNARHPVAIQVAAVQALARTRDAQVGSSLLDRYSAVSRKCQSEILDTVLTRSRWTSDLLRSLESKDLAQSILSVERRMKLLSHANPEIRDRARIIFAESNSKDRADVLHSYQAAIATTGDVIRGRKHFRKHCSSCHKLEGDGSNVGPDLTGLTNRDPQWLLTAILDPNRDVDQRYVTWSAISNDGRLISGLVVEETAATIRMRESGGREHTIQRETIEHFRGSSTSLMPEGFEKELSVEDIADLIAYVIDTVGPVRSNPKTPELPRYPPQIAPFLLDEVQPVETRQRAIDQRPGMGPPIIDLLVKDMRRTTLQTEGTESNSQHVPWIWRVALAVGKRNDGGEIRDLLDGSLPIVTEPLEHWQAVVVGGGIINGLTQVDQWPGRRIGEILEGAPQLRRRWERSLGLAIELAADDAVRAGVRYDALRMVALSKPEIAIQQLQTYLSQDQDRQIQMGAISGLADVEDPGVSQHLLNSLAFVDDRNRKLAIVGLLRTKARSVALGSAIDRDAQLVRKDDFRSLVDHRDRNVAGNASRLLQRLESNTK